MKVVFEYIGILDAILITSNICKCTMSVLPAGRGTIGNPDGEVVKKAMTFFLERTEILLGGGSYQASNSPRTRNILITSRITLFAVFRGTTENHTRNLKE